MQDFYTRYRETYNFKATALSILFLIIIVILLIYFLLNSDNILVSFVCSFLLAVITFGLIGILIGILKGKRQIAKENKYIKDTNPYIYYRELPNNFGIGVTSLLLDSKIENYKDIVAVILDLCARKYLNLVKQNDKYIIKVIKPIDDNLLSNEKYILTLIINNDIKNINYQEWYNYCMKDGINLGLYYNKEINISNKSIHKEKKRGKMHVLISFIISALFFILDIYSDKNIINAFKNSVFLFILIYIILIVPFGLIKIFDVLKKIQKQTKDINYKNILENNLKKTEKGIEELHKLYSFKAFINNFGNFVDKNVDEVVLWDRYLSYAQVFGLTKNIMYNGYKELIDNSSFQIDNIDNINLNNIEIHFN